ncbi:MAG TPA: WD40 repeat domain-containing protein [Micromonosporaceae bacterium]
MNDRALTELFAATEPGGEPPLPAGFAEATLARARHSASRRRGAATAGGGALVLVLVAMLGVVPHLSRTSDPARADPAGPSLPAHFAELSRFTSRSVDQPAGRAIALYEYGDSDGPWQTLVAGADRDTYRRVDAPEDPWPEVLLSPDGRYVLYFKASRGTDEFRLLDLVTGRVEVRHSVEWMSNVGAGITMLAWSPDGRYVAYAVPHPPPNDGRAESSLRGSVSLRDVAILDVVHDTNVLVSLNTPVFGGAFSPDSQRLAVLADPESPMMSVDGKRVGTWVAPAISVDNVSRDMVLPVAWSPDGALLAIGLPPQGVAVGQGTYYGPSNTPIWFVDLAGTGRAGRTDLTGDLLGWRSPTSILVSTSVDEDLRRGDTGAQALVEVSIMDGSRTVLSRFPRSGRCSLTGRCTAYRIQLATNLLRQASIRPSAPDRGWWVPVVHLGSITLAAATVMIIVTIMALRPRRRARQRLPYRDD